MSESGVRRRNKHIYAILRGIFQNFNELHNAYVFPKGGMVCPNCHSAMTTVRSFGWEDGRAA